MLPPGLTLRLHPSVRVALINKEINQRDAARLSLEPRSSQPGLLKELLQPPPSNKFNWLSAQRELSQLCKDISRAAAQLHGRIHSPGWEPMQADMIKAHEHLEEAFELLYRNTPIASKDDGSPVLRWQTFEPEVCRKD